MTILTLTPTQLYTRLRTLNLTRVTTSLVNISEKFSGNSEKVRIHLN